MALKLTNLPVLQELLENYQILVQTPDGLQQIPVDLFGISVSSTSLFETYSTNIINSLNSKVLSTSDKIQRYLSGDTSDEVYMEIKGSSIKTYRGEVLFKDGKAQSIQLADGSGRFLYWDKPLTDCEWYDGLPWKTVNGEKINVTHEETQWPVMSYKYLIEPIKSETVQSTHGLEPTFEDTYVSGNSNLKGHIIKTPDMFIFKTTSSNGECGLLIQADTNGALSGKLLGYWEGLTDIAPDRYITKDNLKEFWYNDQDYYNYSVATYLDTSDKIGWYLNDDLNNKVYSVQDKDCLKFYQAIPRINSSTGSPIKEQAVNIFGNPLFWKQDMTDNTGVTNHKLPLKSGNYVYMTSEETQWPVYIWQYDITELFKIISDGSNGVKQVFSDASGNMAELYINNGLHLRYLKNGTSEPISLMMSNTNGVLSGNWCISDSEGSTSNLLPHYEVVSPTLGVLSLELEHNKTFVVNQVGGTLSINITLPASSTTTLVSHVLIPDGSVVVSWSDNVKGQNLEVGTDGNTEYTIKAHVGVTSNVFASKVVYGA